MKFCYDWIILFIAFLMSFAQGQDESCAGVTCNNKGTCVPNSQYSRGYWCRCDEGWSGQDCLYPEPTVTCGDDTITVVIDKGLVRELGIDDDVRFVYFGHSSASPQCRAADGNDFYKLIIRAPFLSCGTQVIQRAAGDDYTFSNTVVWNREANNHGNLIDRELTLLDFKCIYEDTYTTVGPAIPTENNVLHLVTERGNFEVRMRLFDDNTFTPAHEYLQSPIINIGTDVYVQVELEHMTNKHLVVTLDRCFASQSHDPADPVSTKHVLIADRCVNPNDSTIQIQSNGEFRTSQFKFQMFKWRWSADDVYLHCEVDICNKTSEICTGEGSNCKGSGNFRKRREVLTHEGVYDPTFVPHTDHIVSKGPIRIQFEESTRASSINYGDDVTVDTTVVVLGVTLGVLLFALGVSLGVYCRRRNKGKKKLLKRQAEEATRGSLSSLRISTESF